LLGTCATVLACVLGLTAANWPARAAFPGSNGKIVYAGLSEWDDYEVFVINPDGTAWSNLTSSSSDDYAPAVSPDGSKIAFTSTRDGNQEIYLMDADGTHLARLTANAANDYGPAFSADGSKIAFTSVRDGNAELYTVGTDGTGETRLTTSAAREDGPTFSPDGTRIAFASNRDGNPEIYVAAADGTNPVRLTTDPAADYAPDFAPDGSTIVFISERGGGVGHVYLMGADGSAPTMLTSDEFSFDHHASFSPDGSKILYASQPHCPAGYMCGDILGGALSIINRDGTGATTVIGGPVFSPAWGVASPGTSPPDPTPTTTLPDTIPPPTTSPDTTPPPTTSPDTTPPETNITAGPTGPTNNPSPSFAFTGTDDRTATAQLQYAYRLDNGPWSTYAADTTATLTVGDGAHTISVTARDEAGNEDPTPAQRTFTVDTVAPTGTVTIQGGAHRTRTLTVTLTLTATDPQPASGVTEMRIRDSVSGLTSASWKPYTPTAQWTLSPGAGTKTVYVQYRDAAANPSPVAQDTINYKP
jgi:dipeptidyl aminopeptidase/acylaminoacyl peptidase